MTAMNPIRPARPGGGERRAINSVEQRLLDPRFRSFEAARFAELFILGGFSETVAKRWAELETRARAKISLTHGIGPALAANIQNDDSDTAITFLVPQAG